MGLGTKMDAGLAQFSDALGKDVTDFVSVFVKLYLLTAITFPHEAFTRYHDCVIKPKDYNPEMGIVQTMPALWDYMETALNGVQQWIDQWGKRSSKKP